MAQVEDEGRFPSGLGSRSQTSPDPRRPVIRFQHHHLLGNASTPIPVQELRRGGRRRSEARSLAPSATTARCRCRHADGPALTGPCRGSPTSSGPGGRPRGRRRPSPRLVFARRPPAMPATPSTSRAAIGTPVPSIPSRTRSGGGDASRPFALDTPACSGSADVPCHTGGQRAVELRNLARRRDVFSWRNLAKCPGKQLLVETGDLRSADRCPPRAWTSPALQTQRHSVQIGQGMPPPQVAAMAAAPLDSGLGPMRVWKVFQDPACAKYPVRRPQARAGLRGGSIGVERLTEGLAQLAVPAPQL